MDNHSTSLPFKADIETKDSGKNKKRQQRISGNDGVIVGNYN